MEPLSETELKAIQDRFEATTQGEWKRHPNHRYWVLLPLPEGAVNLRNEADAQFCAHAHQDVPALLAEIARLKALTQWQPYDTAPRNGKHVHVLNKPSRRTYSPAKYQFGEWKYWNEHTGQWERCGKPPTHWMPFPQPSEVTP